MFFLPRTACWAFFFAAAVRKQTGGRDKIDIFANKHIAFFSSTRYELPPHHIRSELPPSTSASSRGRIFLSRQSGQAYLLYEKLLRFAHNIGFFYRKMCCMMRKFAVWKMLALSVTLRDDFHKCCKDLGNTEKIIRGKMLRFNKNNLRQNYRWKKRDYPFFWKIRRKGVALPLLRKSKKKWVPTPVLLLLFDGQ